MVCPSRRMVIWSATLLISLSLCEIRIEVMPCALEFEQQVEQRVGCPFR